jgi:hypothetical protein
MSINNQEQAILNCLKIDEFMYLIPYTQIMLNGWSVYFSF